MSLKDRPAKRSAAKSAFSADADRGASESSAGTAAAGQGGRGGSPGADVGLVRLKLAALDAAANGIVITDIDGKVIWANKAFTHLTGFSLAEVRGRKTSFLRSGHHDDSFYKGLWETILDGRIWHGELVNRRKDGSLYTEEMTITPIRDASDRVANFIAIKQDVSERKRIESDLRMAEQRFDSLFNNHHTVMLIIEPESGRILDANPAATAFYGWSRDELLAKTAFDIVDLPPDEVRKRLDYAVSRGAAHFLSSRHQTAGHSIRDVEAFADLINQGGRRVLFYRIVDITDRRKLERDLLRAQRMESIGTLVGGISHDLNNILAPITLAVEILKLEARNPNDLKVIDTIENSARRGVDLVRHLLSFTRGVEGNMIPFDISRVIREVAAIIKETFPKNITVRTSIERGLGEINADPTQIHQVLMNLVINARDAMPLGGEIEISASNVQIDPLYAAMGRGISPGPYILLTVRDTGEGIPLEIQDRIFDPFFTTKEIGKGTGLGLSTVNSIVESHGGFIRLESEPGRGATFLIYLPRNAVERESASATDSPSEPVGEPPKGGGQQVLIVEDEEDVRKMTRKILETAGYRVLEAADGAEALRLFASNFENIAAVLLDLAMPVMDGFSCMAGLAAFNPSVKVIVTSGGADLRSDLVKLRKHGVTEHVPKPYSARQILEALGRLLCA